MNRLGTAALIISALTGLTVLLPQGPDVLKNM